MLLNLPTAIQTAIMVMMMPGRIGRTWEEVKLGISLPGLQFIISSIIFGENTNTPWKAEGTGSTKNAKRDDECSISWVMYVLLFIIRAHNNKKSQNSSACSLNSQRAQKSSSESVTAELLEDSRARVAQRLKIKTFFCLVSGDKPLIWSVAVTEKPEIW